MRYRPPWQLTSASRATARRSSLEGGAITVDGEGTLLTTASCLRNANRNPGRTREEIDETLRDFLGAETVLWFERGWSQSRDTDGHIDGIAAVRPPG